MSLPTCTDALRSCLQTRTCLLTTAASCFAGRRHHEQGVRGKPYIADIHLIPLLGCRVKILRMLTNIGKTAHW